MSRPTGLSAVNMLNINLLRVYACFHLQQAYTLKLLLVSLLGADLLLSLVSIKTALEECYESVD